MRAGLFFSCLLSRSDSVQIHRSAQVARPGSLSTFISSIACRLRLALILYTPSHACAVSWHEHRVDGVFLPIVAVFRLAQ